MPGETALELEIGVVRGGEVRRTEKIGRWTHLSFSFVTAKRQLWGRVLGLLHSLGSKVDCLYFCSAVCP